MRVVRTWTSLKRISFVFFLLINVAATHQETDINALSVVVFVDSRRKKSLIAMLLFGSHNKVVLKFVHRHDDVRKDIARS